MKVLRSRILVTLILAAIALALGSGVALASLRSWSTATTSGSSVSLGDRPAATPSSGEPDIGGYKPPLQKGTEAGPPGRRAVGVVVDVDQQVLGDVDRQGRSVVR